METMSTAFLNNMMDGPGMADQGLLKLQKISDIWKTEDGAFELRIRSQEAVAILHGKGALDTSISVNSFLTGMMGMTSAMGNGMPPHEIDLIFSFGHTILDVEGNPLVRLERAWYENDTLTVEATDRRTEEKRVLELFRVTKADKPIDPSIPVPKFCPECGHSMQGKPICQACGWRVIG